jgi:hypothetical protein
MRALQDQAIAAAEVPILVAVKLDKWADWMRGGAIGRGYPSKACGMESGGIHTSDDVHDQNDNYAARACDGAIMSLNPLQVAAIGVYWLGNDVRGEHPETIKGLVVDALVIIHRGLILRGCM